MRMQVDTVLEKDPQDFIGWAIEKETGAPVLVIIARAQRVRVVMAPVEAKELGCTAIYASLAAQQMAAAAQGNPAGAAAGLLDANGIPLRTVQ